VWWNATRSRTTSFIALLSIERAERRVLGVAHDGDGRAAIDLARTTPRPPRRPRATRPAERAPSRSTSSCWRRSGWCLA
jgi:hypothetical protein